MGLQKRNDGSGGAAQCMPLLAGGAGATVGAADINVAAFEFITLFTACVIYVNQETTKTMTIVAGSMFAIRTLTTLHVDKVAEYTLA